MIQYLAGLDLTPSGFFWEHSPRFPENQKIVGKHWAYPSNIDKPLESLKSLNHPSPTSFSYHGLQMQKACF